jgi:hypothetical protein
MGVTAVFFHQVARRFLDAYFDRVSLVTPHGQTVSANADLNGISKWRRLYDLHRHSGHDAHLHQASGDPIRPVYRSHACRRTYRQFCQGANPDALVFWFHFEKTSTQMKYTLIENRFQFQFER